MRFVQALDTVRRDEKASGLVKRLRYRHSADKLPPLVRPLPCLV